MVKASHIALMLKRDRLEQRRRRRLVRHQHRTDAPLRLLGRRILCAGRRAACSFAGATSMQKGFEVLLGAQCSHGVGHLCNGKVFERGRAQFAAERNRPVFARHQHLHDLKLAVGTLV